MGTEYNEFMRGRRAAEGLTASSQAAWEVRGPDRTVAPVLTVAEQRLIRMLARRAANLSLLSPGAVFQEQLAA